MFDSSKWKTIRDPSKGNAPSAMYQYAECVYQSCLDMQVI